MTPLRRRLLAAGLLALGACTPTGAPARVDTLAKDDAVAEEMRDALLLLPDAHVRDVGPGGVPTWIDGDLGQLDTGGADRFATALGRIAPAFRVQAEDLAPRSVRTDAQGLTHARYRQHKAGLPVVNGELVLHADARGRIYLANGLVRDGVALSAEPTVAPEAAAQRAVDLTPGSVAATGARLVFHLSPETGALALAHEVTVEGLGARGEPVRDRVYVDAHSGALLARHPQVHGVLDRLVFSASNGTSLPGTRRRSEGQAATGDTHVDENYAHLGTTHACYLTVFGRDSYDGAGAQLRSSVHYGTSYVNAYWNGSQMVYGDGDNVRSVPLGRDLDVTVHELTHGVTTVESDLIYSSEPGALNEAMSDVFAAGCESWTRGWAMDADVWKIAEDIWTPATAGDALRFMANPTQDGSSKDYYPERYTGPDDNGGVHSNSGIANLAFVLLSQGGTHPRGKTSVSVAGVGIEKALRIFYKANTDLMISSTTFQGARNATAQAAADLGYDEATVASVHQAWDAVGVPSGTTPPATVTALTSGVPVGGIGGLAGSEQHYKISVPAGTGRLQVSTSGGSGDMDLYVRLDGQASTSRYTCKSEGSTTAETCAINNPAAGDWYVLLYAYSDYAGLTLTATTTAASTTNVLQNGVPVYDLRGAAGSQQPWTLTVPEGAATLTFSVGGGSGDVDLYVQHGSAPTTTGYRCRPYLSGNQETCAFNAPAAGTWYVMLRGYSAYSGVWLEGRY